MKSIKILQHYQESATFLNATFSGKHRKLLQLHVTENGKCHMIYYITIYFFHLFIRNFLERLQLLSKLMK